jgi:hypothetical protein
MINRRSPQIFQGQGQGQSRALNDISPIDGLDFILAQFREPLWPRTVSTRSTEGRQLVVSSREEALARFIQSNWLDCRISAYPVKATVNPSALERLQGLACITPRSLIVMIDLDKGTFKSERALELALTKTCQKIEKNFQVEPTVLWSGNGFHIYLALDSEGIILENVKEFSSIQKVSIKFLRFAEFFLSSGKSDKSHNTTVSFNNCMLRIPGSFNAKNNAQVQIINSKTIPAIPATIPSIRPLLRDFRRFLIDQQIAEGRRTRVRRQSQNQNNRRRNFNSDCSRQGGPNSIGWIEKLLQTPLDDFRKYCIWRILTPYLINIKKLSAQESLDIIRQWLAQCDSLRNLDFRFNVDQRIIDGLDSVAKKGYLPISFEKLKEENPQLYNYL